MGLVIPTLVEDPKPVQRGVTYLCDGIIPNKEWAVWHRLVGRAA